GSTRFLLCGSSAPCTVASVLSERYSHHPARPPFPTRRSSDLTHRGQRARHLQHLRQVAHLEHPGERQAVRPGARGGRLGGGAGGDRKSTRLNSSHQISPDAACCVKKKKTGNNQRR